MDEKDLSTPIPKSVLENQSPPTGQRVIFESPNDVLHEYFHEDWFARADRFSKRLDADLAWIEGFVSHAPSVGSYYEGITRDLLTEYLPGSVKVGTGFVFDTLQRRCSPQLDILVYSELKDSPVYSRGEFVIVNPDAVAGICEVKKKLTSADLTDWVDKTISQNLGWHPDLPFGIQESSLFALSSDVSTETLARTVVKSVAKFTRTFQATTQGGHKAILACFGASLPAVYLRDRSEYISVSASKCDDGGSHYELSVEILRPSGARGISPLLASFDIQSCSPAKRDLLTGFLIERVSSKVIGDPLLLMRRLSSSELLEYFDDAKSILSAPVGDGKRPIAAITPAWALPETYSSLAEYSRLSAFSWVLHDGTDGGHAG